LPNDIQAGDQYTITLKTEYYDERPQAGIDAGWDDDSYVRPVLDGGGGSFNILDFANDRYWELANSLLANTTYRAIYTPPFYLKNIVVRDVTNNYHSIATGIVREFRDVYILNCAGIGCVGIFEHVHLNDNDSTHIGIRKAQAGEIILKNVSIGKVKKYSRGINFVNVTGNIIGENVFIDADTLVVVGYWHYHLPNDYCKITSWNGESNKLHQWFVDGEIYNVDEDATIDPPSGATTYIKMSPNSHCSSLYPLVHEEERYQSGASKTYTWKFYPSGWSNLTTSDIEIEAWFLEESSGTKRKYATANPSSVTNDTWNDLSITVSPEQAGTVYFQIKLKKYELGAFIALDPKPNVG